MPTLIDTELFREHVKTSLGDDALQRYIDAEDALILERLGPIGTITDVRFPRGNRVFLLGRRPTAFVSVTERLWDQDTVLDPDDYIMVGKTFRRLDTGAHPPDWSTDRITFVYNAATDVAVRTIALLQLVALDVLEQDASAVISRTVGKHSVSYATPEARQESREAIWANLDVSTVPFFA